MAAEKASGSETKSRIFAVKVSSGYENLVGMIAAEKAKILGVQSGIISILTLDELKSFIMVEAKSKTDVISLYYGLKHVRGHVRGAIDLKEIEHLLYLYAIYFQPVQRLKIFSYKLLLVLPLHPNAKDHNA